MKQKPVFMLVCWLVLCMTMQFASAQDDVASTQRVSIAKGKIDILAT